MPDVQVRDVEQLAMFMNARDNGEYGTAKWEHLDPAGQDAYMTDATSIVGAMLLLGWTPPPAAVDIEWGVAWDMKDDGPAEVEECVNADSETLARRISGQVGRPVVCRVRAGAWRVAPEATP